MSAMPLNSALNGSATQTSRAASIAAPIGGPLRISVLPSPQVANGSG